jgi:hypothetical protein
MAKDWRDAREKTQAAIVDRYKRLRQQLGQSASDKAIERQAKKEADAGARRAIRDAGEG